MREYLKELRLTRKIKQSDVAKKLGVSESYYCLIERGERLPKMTIDFAQRLSEILNVDPDYINTKEKEEK